MSKTLLNLIAEAAALADETFDNARWVEWFNNGLDDLSTVLFLSKQSTISEDESGIFSLPTDFLAVLRLDGAATNLRKLSLSDDLTAGYKVLGNKVYLQGDAATDIVLTYYRTPLHLTTADTGAEVDLPELCNRALIYFACAQAMLREDETERYNLFMEDYLRAKQLLVKSNRAFGVSSTGAWGVVR